MSNKLTALIIDDDNDLCFMLGEIFRNKDFSVSVANSLSEAKILLHNQNPSVIILDNSLPDGKGSEFVSYLNKMCPYSKIIMVTGDYENATDEFKGITHFIRKPFTLTTFRSIIDSDLQIY